MKYLGHLVGEGQVCPLAAKIEAIQTYPKPQTKIELREFLGLISYYRKFINHLADMANPLFRALKESESDRIEWSSEKVESFEQLRKSLSSTTVLKSLNFSQPFYLQTDASGTGIEAILSQIDSRGQEHPVAYYSRKLAPTQRNYSVTEQECLAVVMAVRHFAFYLESMTLTVVTDHRALTWLTQL